jgi:glyoxylase-like metal-dependent hydrolase (beta-lactamase superfamily II)
MELKIEQLGKRVFAVIGSEGATNFGVIRGDDGSAILIDADIRRVDEIEEALRQTECKNLRFLCLTHENFDHSSANDYFEKKGAVIIASKGCFEALRESGEAKFIEMSSKSPYLYRRFPDLKMGMLHIVFQGCVTVHLPGATIHLHQYERSHSKGDTTAFFAEEEILFAGDLLYTKVHPVVIYGDFLSWIKTLDILETQPFKKIVPGHGPVGKNREAGVEYVKQLRLYLQDFTEKLLDVKEGRKTRLEIELEIQRSYPSLGKTKMIKRNIDFFLK